MPGASAGAAAPRPIPLEEISSSSRSSFPLLVGRHVLRADDAEILSSLSLAFDAGEGSLLVLKSGEGLSAARTFRRGLACNACGRTFADPVPALFSFNSPRGACETCEGFGRIVGIDAARVIPDGRKTLRERPIAPFNSPSYESAYDDLKAASRRLKLRWDVPWDELTPQRARRRLEGLGRLVRRRGPLQVPREEAVQGPRPRPARALPRLHDVPGLPRGPPEARGARRHGRREDDRRGLRPDARGAPRVPRLAAAPGVRAREGGIPRRGAVAARADARRDRPRLPDARAHDAHALGRRGPARPARLGDRQRAHRDAVRPRRADGRPARPRHGPAPRRPRAPRGRRATPSSRSSTTRTSSAPRTT